MPRSIIVKPLKTKDIENIFFLKAVRKKRHLIYMRKTVSFIVDFSPRTMEARRHHIFQVIKERYSQPTFLYQAKIPFRNEVENKTFSMKKNEEDLSSIEFP